MTTTEKLTPGHPIGKCGAAIRSREDHYVKLGNITFDCADVLRVARFWSAALERPLDERSNEYFASIGGTDPERVEPAWYFARVPEAKQAKNRVHVDLISPDPLAVQRLLSLGATVVGEHEVPGGKPPMDHHARS